MVEIDELEKFAKGIGLIKSDEDLSPHYRYWDISTSWKAEEMLKIIPGDKKFSRLLSVGCGYGMELQKVSKMLNINKAIGIDISEITIKMAEKVSSNCIFIVGDACSLPFNNDSFDLVILSDIIEHIEQPEILLKEAQRVAKYAVMNIPLEKCFKTRKRKYGVTDASEHLFALNEKTALTLLNSVGYRIVSRLTSHSPEELYGGRVFRIRKIGAVFRFLERFLRKYLIKFHTYIFGINLFVFCERPKGDATAYRKKAVY